MVKQRKGDLTKIAADQAAFLDQKDLPSGKKTLKAYYWKICGAESTRTHKMRLQNYKKYMIYARIKGAFFIWGL